MHVSQLYKKVADGIIRDIEAGGLPPWLKPWKNKRTNLMPVNHSTGREYQGINILMLWGQREAMGYEQNAWLTYKQCDALGGQVRQGEKGTPIIYVSHLAIVEDEDEQRLVPFARVYFVFNVQQCDGLTLKEPEPELPEHERNERAERFLTAPNATILWGQSMAAYQPSKDTIIMPARSAFVSPESLYATWSHEHIHWTGAKHRLNRELSGRFKEESYAFEELVAEIGAAMVCAHLGITGELRHASYCESWLRILKNDPRAILSAASLSSKAADFLRSFSEKVEDAA